MSMAVPVECWMIENTPKISIEDDYFEKLEMTEASGEIVSFDNDLVPLPFLELKANIVAQQDGTPWFGTEHNSVPYNFRAVKDANATRYGNTEYGNVVGGTVAWNQCARFESADIPSASNGITYTYTDGTSVLINGTATAQETRTGWFGLTELVGLPLSRYNHKVLIYARLRSGTVTNGTVSFILPPNIACGLEGSKIGILQYSNTNQIRGAISIPSGTVCNNANISVNVIDLTQMFGSTIADYIYSLEQATAGAGVAWFKKLFPKPYYAYNAGELISVKTTAHETIGFNQWDEETVVISGTRVRSKNYIPVLPNTTYYFNSPSGTYADVGEYSEESSSSLITYQYKGGSSNPESNKFTTSENTHFILFTMNTAYGTTYKNDICINLSDASLNGQYKPYSKHTYALDSDLELRGIPKLDASNNLYYDGDIYPPSGNVTRKYGIVDLGTLTWERAENSGIYRFQSSGFSGGKPLASNAVVANILCVNYKTDSWSNVAGTANDKSIGLLSAGNIMAVQDNSYNDAVSFKSAMSGVYLVYELATPTTETADPYTSAQAIDEYGTEAFVDGRTVEIPVGHDSYFGDVFPISGWDEVNVYVRGINQWDEECELGGISQSTGGNVANTTTLRTKNYVPVIPNTRYYLNTGKFTTFIGYDENKNFVRTGMYVNAGDGGYYCDVPSDVHYIRWQFATTYGTTYNHDISFNYPSTDTDYHAYNGQTYATAVNVWDEEWEVGEINGTTGANANTGVAIRSKNYIPVINTNEYYFKIGYTACTIYQYSSQNVSGYIGAIYGKANATFTLANNCKYIRFATGTGYGTTYKNDICINLHWDGERDGEYEEYKEYVYPLDSDLELRGLPKLDTSNNLVYDGDTYESDGTVTRKYGIVDLGTLTWERAENSGIYRFQSSGFSGGKPLASNAVVANILCVNYKTDSWSNVAGTANDKSIGLLSAGNIMAVQDNSYNDAVSFKSAMSGVYLVYELATPTTETADPYTSAQAIDEYGTEAFVDGRTVEIPVGHDSYFGDVFPISGWDEVNVYVRGINQWDEECELGGISQSTGGNVANTTTLRTKNYVPVIPNTRYYLNTGKFTTFIGYDENKNFVRTGMYVNAGDGGYYCDVPSDVHYIRWQFATTYGTTYNHDISFNYPSTDTDYHAYNGQTYATAVNVWDEEWEVGEINGTTGANANTGVAIRSKNYIPVINTNEYYFKIGYTACTIYQYSSQNVSGYIGAIYGKANATFTLANNCEYIRFATGTGYGTTYNNDISINFPSNNTAYIPFKGSTATQNYMDTFGHGVYGGTLDVTTGVLTITYTSVDLGTVNWIKSGNNGLFLTYTLGPLVKLPPTNNVNANILCDRYKTENYVSHSNGSTYTTWQTASEKYVAVLDNNYASITASAFKTAMSGVQLVYELATPQVVQLTAQQVKMLVGKNNVWSDVDEVEVKFYVKA